MYSVYSLAVVAVVVIMLLASAIRILNEYERGVIFRLGRLIGEKGPGLIILIPIVDRMVRVSLRTVVVDVPPQDVVTKDNVTVKVNAVLFFRVMDAIKSVVEVENFIYATSQLAQTTLRSVVGSGELDDLLAKQEEINRRLQEMLDRDSAPWGIKISKVELKHIDLPENMQRAIARQAEAERERRSKVINAEGEFQAAARLSDAAGIIEKRPIALQLRYLQTLAEIATENNSTTLFPIPIDLFRPFLTPDRGKESDRG